jgi:hypothetical protein
MMVRLISLVNWRRKGTTAPPALRISGVVHVKIFLAAYLIDSHHLTVFDNISDDLSTAAYASAGPFLKNFHQFAEFVKTGFWQDIPLETRKTLETSFCTYLRDFKAWKMADEKRLVGRIEDTVFKLLAAEDSLFDKPDRLEALQQVRVHVDNLMKKMAIVAGASAGEAFEEDVRNERERLSGLRQLHSMPVDAERLSNGSGVGGSRMIMSGQQLAHEVLLDPSFKLGAREDCPGDSLTASAPVDDRLVLTSVRRMIKPEFWAELEAELSAEPQPRYEKLLTFLETVRSTVQSIVGNHSDHALIADIIDLDHIKHRLTTGAMDVGACTIMVGSIVCIFDGMHDRLGSLPEKKQEMDSQWQECMLNMQIAADASASAQAGYLVPKAIANALRMLDNMMQVLRVGSANLKLNNMKHVIR